MAQKSQTAYSTGNWSNAQLKKDRAEGIETPRTDTKAHYREDMASQDFAQSRLRKGRVATGKTPKRYYANFDRGAAKYAKKRAAKSKARGSSKSR